MIVRAERTLREVFGLDAFRPGQSDVVAAMLAGRDVLSVAPTGSGKSISYWVPAVVEGGLTMVVSPLIALMKDQVDRLTERGVPATFINSSLDRAEDSERLRQAYAGAFGHPVPRRPGQAGPAAQAARGPVAARARLRGYGRGSRGSCGRARCGLLSRSPGCCGAAPRTGGFHSRKIAGRRRDLRIWDGSGHPGHPAGDSLPLARQPGGLLPGSRSGWTRWPAGRVHPPVQPGRPRPAGLLHRAVRTGGRLCAQGPRLCAAG